MKNPKVALAHEFLVQYGGAERTFEAIAELFPEAPIYTAKYVPDNFPEAIRNRKIISPDKSIINKATKYLFTFMMAPVFESFDMSEYDLIISDGNTWNKGILTKPGQMHITYIHTPPRFLYKYSTESTKRDKWYFKVVFSYIDNILRLWDFISAQRPEYLLANSIEIQSRIEKFYRRKATVIYPPVDLATKTKEVNQIPDKPYYLAVGRLVKYKNIDKLVQAFNILDMPLVIVGSGSFEKELKKMAHSNITFVGNVNDDEKRYLYKHALGVINPVEDEDFGIVPIEAFAMGTPVLAHNSGGHKETVKTGINGLLYSENSIEQLIQAIKDFDKAIRSNHFDKTKIIESAQPYSRDRFKREFESFVKEKWEAFNSQNA